jgi:dihydrodipicolinate synthase/N-acetylneuraminate lyase
MLKTLKDEKGVIAIATTPFDENNQIYFNSVDTLGDYSERNENLIKIDKENELL